MKMRKERGIAGFPCKRISTDYFTDVHNQSKKNDSLTDQDRFFIKERIILIEEMDGLKFRIGPKSFYQTNTNQALRLYRTAQSLPVLQEKK